MEMPTIRRPRACQDADRHPLKETKEGCMTMNEASSRASLSHITPRRRMKRCTASTFFPASWRDRIGHAGVADARKGGKK